MKLFKLYTRPFGRKPISNIWVYYKGVPLFTPAAFEGDRYSFRLPLNLQDKMIAGEMWADFCFADKCQGSGKTSGAPVSLVLSDRYD